MHANHVVTEIERVRAPLENLGINVKWMVKRVAQLADGQKMTSARDDKEVIASYSIATWLHSWGVERVSDCNWAE